MRRIAVVNGMLLFGAAGFLGCANGDLGMPRRSTDGVTINDATYGSKDVNDQSVFGKEVDGLSSNPMNKPSKDLLGDKGAYSEITLTADPESYHGYINEITEIRIKAVGITSGSSENAKPKSAKGARVVLVLERSAGANGSISVDESALFDKKMRGTERKIVAKTNEKGEIVVRLSTGSAYNGSKPVYYLNAWHADAKDPGVSTIFVSQPPKRSDLDKGDDSTVNDLTPPAGMDEIKDYEKNIEIVNLDPLEQQLFAKATKRLRVRLYQNNSSMTEHPVTAKEGEPVCWKLVGRNTDKNNNGAVVEASDGEDIDADTTEKCSKVNDKGEFWLDFYTGSSYDAKYYVNFFHPESMPLSYEVLTFGLPDTMGEKGEDAFVDLDGDGKDDMSIPGFEDNISIDKATGSAYINACKTREIIDKIFDPKTKPGSQISEICTVDSVSDVADICTGDAVGTKCAGKDLGKDEKPYICRLEQKLDGTWAVVKCNGKEVKADVDGDGKDDMVHIVVDTSGEGAVDKGVDINGDGKPDIAPDICAKLDSSAPDYAKLCPDEVQYSFLWSEDKSAFSKRKLSTGIDDDFEFFVQSLDDGSPSAASGISAELIGGKTSSKKTSPNNAKLLDGSKQVDSLTFDTDSSEKSTAELSMWSGTAYDASYYVMLTHDKAKATMIPIATTNTVKLPGGEGDSPDDSVLEEGGAAVTPPEGMPPADPNLGTCYITISAEEIEKIQSLVNSKDFDFYDEKKNVELTDRVSLEVPIVKTLMLKAGVVRDKTKSLVKDTKTYWKVTRGKSTYNNATLMSSVNHTDSKGTATGQFYTGTGYESVYYVSVFHPNAENPAVFTIKTIQSSGSVDGIYADEDPVLPDGDSTGTDSEGNSGKCCTGECTSCAEGKVNCTNIDGDEYIYCEKLDVTNGEHVTKTLPQRACDASCADDFENCPTKDGEGCLLLKIEEESPISALVDSSATVHATLEWLTDSEDAPIPVKDKLIWTLNVPEGGDARLLGSKTYTNKEGRTTVFVKTGTVTTTYKINVMHPNIHEKGNMKPVSAMLSVVDRSQMEMTRGDELYIKAKTDKEIDTNNTLYYVLSGDYNRCDTDFVLQNKSDIEKSCRQATVPSIWNNSENKKYREALCAVQSDKDGSKQIQVPDSSSRYIVYAVEFNEHGVPERYGCEDMIYLPKPVPKDETDKKNKIYTSTVNVTVRMSKIPLELGDFYHTRNLIDLGPLIEIPPLSECGESGKGNSVGCLLAKVQDFYHTYIGQNPGDKLVEAFEKFIFQYEVERNNNEGCLGDNGLGKFVDSCKDENGSLFASINTEKIKKSDGTNSYYEYKESECICGKIYYYVAGCDEHCSSFGAKAVPLVMKVLKSLINKAFEKAALEDVMCNTMDSLQFVELTGKVKFDRKLGNSAVHVTTEFTGGKIPYTDKSYSIGRIVTGETLHGTVTPDSASVMIPDTNLSFSYGMLIYDIIGNLLPHALDEQGQLKLRNLLSCSELLGGENGINLPLIGKIPPEFIDALCSSVLNQVEDKVIDFAAQKSINLNMKLSGSAEYSSEGGTCEHGSSKISCLADTLSNGMWSGKGDMGGKRSDISGLWVGSSNENMPELMYGTQSVDEFMAERSVCRKLLREEAKNEKLDEVSNRACLMGSFDNPKSRVSNNLCNLDDCNQLSIVVCKDGQFNAMYAHASGADIIKAANKACLDSTDPSCTANPEIINKGHAVSNKECKEHCAEPQCQISSILECSDGGKQDAELLKENCNCTQNPCTEVEIANCASKACSGKCDAPECVMNSDVTCTEIGESGEEEPVPEPMTVLYSWDFAVEGKPDNSKFVADLKDPGIGKDGYKVTIVNTESGKGDAREFKLVTGKDGALGAIGMPYIEGAEADKQNSVKVEWPNTVTVNKVVFSVYGDTRTIKYGQNHGKEGETKTKAAAWEEVIFEPGGAVHSPFEIKIIDNGDATPKLMRIDDIILFGNDSAE